MAAYFKSLEVLLFHTGIHHKQVNKRGRCTSVNRVLDSTEVGDQLSRLVLLCDPLIVRREGVPLETEVTDPQLSSVIHLTWIVVGLVCILERLVL